MLAIGGIIFFIGFDVANGDATSNVAAQVDIDIESYVSKTDTSYICAGVDWWPSSKCDYGWCPWGSAGILPPQGDPAPAGRRRDRARFLTRRMPGDRA